MLVSLPEHKEHAIIELIEKTLLMHSMPIRHLAKVIGKLISCFIACLFGKLHYRNLECTKLRALKLNRGRYSAKCRLKSEDRAELNWWLLNLPHTSAPLFRTSPGPTIFTDACERGWGCYFQGKYANGHFSTMEKPFSINTKETLAILYGFRSFLSKILNTGCETVLIMSDSTTAISYVKKMGGMQSELRSKIVLNLWNIASDNDPWLEISHIPGIFNTESDTASRCLSEKTEWQLDKIVFQNTCKHFNLSPDIDLFASRLNFQVADYYSFGPDPYCAWVDAFTIKWNKNVVYYMFPPFNLILRCLSKIRQDRTKCVLAILPKWPNQPWYSMMLTMLLPGTSPLQLTQTKNILTLPWDLSMIHPNFKHLKLHSVVLCGTDFARKTHQ